MRQLAEGSMEYSNGDYYQCSHGQCDSGIDVNKMTSILKKLDKDTLAKVYKFLPKIAKEKAEYDDLEEDEEERLLENARDFLKEF